MSHETEVLRKSLERVAAGEDLSQVESGSAFEAIMSGRVDPLVMSAFVGALSTKGESIEEITGAVIAMRAKVVRVRCSPGAIDTCGTGGDGISTFNVSTTAAIIAAAAGAVVAKHGNRTHTRVSGSAEVLERLGVDIDADVATVERCLSEIGIGFLYAQMLHPAMKHAAAIRTALGIRTVFNLLGPLANPALVQRQVLGVPRPELTTMLAEVLRNVGAKHVWVVHGSDGLCDLTITGTTRVVEVSNGNLREFDVDPQQCGLARAALSTLCVDSPQRSAEVVREILGGTTGPCRDHALLNAGAALVVAGVAGDLAEGVSRAADAVDSGAALARLDALVRITQAKHSQGMAGSGNE